MSDIAERVKKIVVDHLGVEEAKVTENASFIDDLGADSLDTVELVMAFEESSDARFRTGMRRRSSPSRMRSAYRVPSAQLRSGNSPEDRRPARGCGAHRRKYGRA